MTGEVLPDGDRPARGDVAMHHPAAVHPGHRPGQPQPKLDQHINRQRLGQPRQARAANVGHYDRPRIPRFIQHLGDPIDTTQPLQHSQLMPQLLCSTMLEIHRQYWTISG